MYYIAELLEGKDPSLELIVWSVFAGIILASIVVIYNKTVVGTFVRRLLDLGADSEETAVTLAESGCLLRFLLKLSLGKNSTLRKTVSEVKSEKKGEERYYIPSEAKDRAKSLYRQKGSGIISVIITIVLFFAIALLTIKFLPGLLDALKASYTAAL